MASSVEIRLAAALKDDPGELEYEALQHRTSGALIYPTRALASWRAVRLAREGHYTGIFGAFFCEFSAFAHELLRTCGMDPLLVDSRERRLMVQNCLEETLRDAGETAGIQIRETGIAGLAFQLLDAGRHVAADGFDALQGQRLGRIDLIRDPPARQLAALFQSQSFRGAPDHFGRVHRFRS